MLSSPPRRCPAPPALRAGMPRQAARSPAGAFSAHGSGHPIRARSCVRNSTAQACEPFGEAACYGSPMFHDLEDAWWSASEAERLQFADMRKAWRRQLGISAKFVRGDVAPDEGARPQWLRLPPWRG
jgi:hypothetical protein